MLNVPLIMILEFPIDIGSLMKDSYVWENMSSAECTTNHDLILEFPIDTGSLMQYCTWHYVHVQVFIRYT